MNDRLILLGTAGGAATMVRPTTPRTAAHGISSALIVEGRIYIVDFGQSSARQLTLADPLGHGSRRVMKDIEACFITHLHSDHTMDLVNYALTGFNQGWPSHSVPVMGPWARRIHASDYSRADLDPGDVRRAPGTRELVERLRGAYEADSLDREFSGDRQLLRARMHGVDIVPPQGVDRDSPSPTPVRPWCIFEDERVRVTTTLVAHGAMYPALAFRFDTARSSVVFSGDTGPSAALIALAEDADVLVHEVIDSRFALRWFGEPPYTDAQEQIVKMVLAKHTSAEKVGEIAAAAGVRRLVLSHLVPGNLDPEYWAALVSGFDGEVIVGEDLTTLDLVTATSS